MLINKTWKRNADLFMVIVDGPTRVENRFLFTGIHGGGTESKAGARGFPAGHASMLVHSLTGR